MKRRELSIAKITRPGAGGILPRERLFRLLDQGIDFPITWVSGPPGSGKTALVTSYLDARKLSCLWYQVDERDGDIATFFYYMGIAAKKASPLKRKPLPLLTSEYLTGIPAFTRRYFEDLYSRLSYFTPAFGDHRPVPPFRKGGTRGDFRKRAIKRGFEKKKVEGRFNIVFDNYQDVPIESGFHEMIYYGMDIIPEGMNIFILSRNEPPPQLARLRANNKIHFLGWNEIKFTTDETREMFRTKSKEKLSNETLLELQTKTEGWAAGLILIVLASQIQNIDYQSMSRFPTKEIFEYFATEIFQKIDREVQEFLLQAAFLPRMTGSMAESLTGISNSAQIISNLSENHYFTEKHSVDNPIYQFHPLFREFLLSRTKGLFAPEKILSIQRKASALLEGAGQIEDAVTLLRDANDWTELIRHILNQAQALIAQGRSKTLQEWIMSIPVEIREKAPWLLHWLGTCKQPFRPAESWVLFEKAFELFQERGDVSGTLLAWSGAVDSIVLEWNDFTLLDRWIEWLDQKIQRDSSFPSPEIEARVTSSMAGALVYRQPYHPGIREWIERSLSLSREIEDINLRMQACLCAVNYYSWTGDLTNYSIVTEEIRKMALLPTASPLLVVTWKWIEALMYNRSTESYEQALESISEGLEIAEKNGIHVWDQMLFSQGVYSSLNKRDMALAGEFLKKTEATIEKSRRQSLFQYHYLSGWYHFLNGNLSRATLSAEASFQLVEQTGMYFARILSTLLMAQLFHEKGEYENATTQLSHAKALIHRSGSRILEYMCLMKEAQFHLDQETEETEKRGLEALGKAMEMGRKESYIHLFPSWQPSVMTRLCLKALTKDIEVEYVQALIRKHHLFPDALPPDLEKWPWPIKIFTLGRFELLKDGKPLRFSGKVQKKPLLMLKAMIALGGKDVREDQIADLFWPEADGDQTHSSFTTTLSRLRQLLGEEKTIKFQEGRATLDPRYCWVDVWAFDRMFGKAEFMWKESQQSMAHRSEAVSLTEKAIGSYQGHFLPGDEEYGWTTSYRDRFRSKFLQLVTKFGQYLKETDQWEKAVQHFQKALEIDDLAEELYQHLMVCYYQLDQRTKVVQVYRRCKETLSSALGMDPSPKTELIYKKLIERE